MQWKGRNGEAGSRISLSLIFFKLLILYQGIAD